MADDLVLFDVTDGVATISLNRPDRHNAFTDALDEAMWSALAEVRDRDDIRCVVLRGEGSSFSSGRDMAELGKRPEGVSDFAFIEQGHRHTRLLYSLDVPIIAALKGWVIGGSFERALLCDLRVAASDTKMLLPEVKHGVLCDSAGTARLFQIAGHGLATDLVLTGRVLDAQEALTHGIVARVVEADELDDVVGEMAADIASRSPLAVKLSLQTIRGLASPEVERTLDHELLAQTALMASPQYQAQRDARLAQE